MNRIRKAYAAEAPQIARMIMEAMDYDCCRFFAGPNHSLVDFEVMMTRLVRRTDSQYSYLNTLVYTSPEDTPAGIIVAYDGSQLHELRKAFIEEALQAFGIDYSGMDDETQAGEYYLDSLCVDSRYRHQGIASALLRAAWEEGNSRGLDTGLLVDFGNPSAEKLYAALGFEFKNYTQWGGHKMKHLVKLGIRS